MILKGKSRTGPVALAAHLLNAEKNERVTLAEVKGTVAQDLRGALIEMDAYAAGTNCTKSLYHGTISPQPPNRLTPEQRSEAIAAFEEKFGLTGHSRAVVIHEKLGREHIHVVWSRIDLQTMRAAHDGHNFRRHEEVARDLERRFGHDHVQGAHAEREGVERPDRTPSRAELRQEERTGIKGKDVKADVTEAFKASDNALAFQAALEERGYILAQGDRRDFVIVDRAGGVHSLARRIEGIKAAELRAFMAPIDRESLPSADQARQIAHDTERHRREARSDAKLEQAYGRGGDYVSQTTAALKDHKRRSPINDEPRPERSVEKSDDEARITRLLDEDRRDKRKSAEAAATEIATPRARDEAVTSKFDKVEMTEAQQQKMRRLLDGGEGGRDDDHDPDKQREVPGGGRTRSR